MAKKSKELTFSSERMEQRRNARRYWIPAVTLVVMIGVAAAIALLMRSDRGGTFTGDNTLYPYTWTEEKSGAVTLEIDRSGAEGYQWIVGSAGAGVALEGADASAEGAEPVVVSMRSDEKQPAGKTRFVLTPASAGRAVFTLDLQNETDPMEHIYELSVLMEVREGGGKLNAFLISAGGKAVQGVIYGEGSDFVYTAFLNEGGNLVLSVTGDRFIIEEEPEAEPTEVPESEQLTGDGVEEDEEPPEEVESLYYGHTMAEYEVMSEEERAKILEEGRKEAEEQPEEEMDYFGYTLEEFMALPEEVREAMLEEEFAKQRAQEQAEQQEPVGWHCVSDNDGVAEVLDMTYDAEGVYAILLPGEEQGSATVRMHDYDTGAEITLLCEVDGNGDFLITSHSVQG